MIPKPSNDIEKKLVSSRNYVSDDERTRDNMMPPDDLNISSKNYKSFKKNKNLLQISSIEMLTEHLDPLNDIEGITESL